MPEKVTCQLCLLSGSISRNIPHTGDCINKLRQTLRRETLNLSTCADSSTNTKADGNGQEGKILKLKICHVSCVRCQVTCVIINWTTKKMMKINTN